MTTNRQQPLIGITMHWLQKEITLSPASNENADLTVRQDMERHIKGLVFAVYGKQAKR